MTGSDEEARQAAEDPGNEENFSPVLRIQDTDDGLCLIVANTEGSLSGEARQAVEYQLADLIAGYMAGVAGSPIMLIKEGPASPGAGEEQERPEPGNALSAAARTWLTGTTGTLADLRRHGETTPVREASGRGFVQPGLGGPREGRSKGGAYMPSRISQPRHADPSESVPTEEHEADYGQPETVPPIQTDDAYYDEVRKAVGRGTRSSLFGTSTKSLERGLSKLKDARRQQEQSPS